MMASSREGHESKQEGDDTFNIERFSKASSSSIPRQWAGFKNPRIVRVSRSFGGKDRHSKVCTIRGLRDRRIRLSVPTAVQLYDLQDQLGLNQPSKVVDWLLEATKLDIDKLPPLHFPQGFSQFPHNPQATTNPIPFHESNLSLGPFYDYNSNNLMMGKSRFSWDNVDSKGKEDERGKWIKTNYEQQHENHDGVVGVGYNSLQVSTQKLFPMGSLLNNAAMSYNYHHLEPSSLSLSQFGSNGLFHSQSQVDHNSHPSNGNNGSSVQFPSSNLPLLSGSQFLFAPTSSAAATPSFFTPFMTAPSVENNDPRQFNFLNSVSSQHYPHPLNIPSFQSLNSPIRPFPTLPFNSKLLDSNDNKDSNARP